MPPPLAASKRYPTIMARLFLVLRGLHSSPEGSNKKMIALMDLTKADSKNMVAASFYFP